MDTKNYVFNKVKPVKNDFKAFLISAFSYSDKKVIKNVVIPIKNVSWDNDFNSLFADFLKDVMSRYDGFKDTCDPVFGDMSFKLVNWDSNHSCREDDDMFDVFCEPVKDAPFHEEHYRLKENDINIITKKGQSMCAIKASGYDLAIHFTMVDDASTFEEKVLQYEEKMQIAKETFKQAVLTEFKVSEKEYDFIKDSLLKLDDNFIVSPLLVANMKEAVKRYSIS